nr:MAG TPA: hypothetical protein [Caudoviricetes sp.]
MKKFERSLIQRNVLNILCTPPAIDILYHDTYLNT